MRDVVQNDLLQVLAILAMEPPVGTAAEALRDEQMKVLRAVRAPERRDIVRGQYRGLSRRGRRARDSDVETYAALRLEIDSWRWAGVPFGAHGKRLPVTATEVMATFRRPPQRPSTNRRPPRTNYLLFRLGPDRVAIASVRASRWPARQWRGRRPSCPACNARPTKCCRTSACSAMQCGATRASSRGRIGRGRLGHRRPTARERPAGRAVRPGHWGPVAAGRMVERMVAGTTAVRRGGAAAVRLIVAQDPRRPPTARQENWRAPVLRRDERGRAVLALQRRTVAGARVRTVRARAIAMGVDRRRASGRALRTGGRPAAQPASAGRSAGSRRARCHTKACWRCWSSSPTSSVGAAEYADTLARRFAPGAVFDIVQLGLGDDGHTASLVPGDPVLGIRDRDVAVTHPYQGTRRMTLMYRALQAARERLWLVTGAAKVCALVESLDGARDERPRAWRASAPSWSPIARRRRVERGRSVRSGTVSLAYGVAAERLRHAREQVVGVVGAAWLAKRSISATSSLVSARQVDPLVRGRAAFARISHERCGRRQVGIVGEKFRREVEQP